MKCDVDICQGVERGHRVSRWHHVPRDRHVRDDGVDRVSTINVESPGGEHRVHEKASDFSDGHSDEKLPRTVRVHQQVCSPEREHPVWTSKRKERLASQKGQGKNDSRARVRTQANAQRNSRRRSCEHKRSWGRSPLKTRARRGRERNGSTSCRRLVNQCKAKLVEVCPLTMRHEADRGS